MQMRLMVVSHKDYWMPDDPIYLPVQVNSGGKPSFHPQWQRDDQGQNISSKMTGPASVSCRTPTAPGVPSVLF